MNILHTMQWNAGAQIFRCRTGACNFEVTWDRMKDVGYRPSKDGVVFVDEDDFQEEETGEKNNSSDVETS